MSSFREQLDQLVAEGKVEVVGWENGEPLYRLTEAGIAAARAVFERHGIDPDTTDDEAFRLLLTRLDAEEQAGSS